MYTKEKSIREISLKKYYWSVQRGVKGTQLCLTLLKPIDFYSPWNSPAQNTGVGSPSLLQQIFPTQDSNWGLLHCRQILYQLSYQGSQYTEEVAINSKFKHFMVTFYLHNDHHFIILRIYAFGFYFLRYLNCMM